MENDSVDIIITSPPYNIGKNRINGDGQKREYDQYDDEMTIEEYFKQTKKWIDEFIRVSKYHVFYNIQEVKNNKGIIKFLYENYADKIKEVFIWAKTNPQPCIVDTMCGSGYEYIFCFSKDKPETRKFYYCDFDNRNGKIVHNVFNRPVNSGKETEGHSFAFPLWLPEYFINNFSKKGDLIYDPFMGSGTTAIAAIKLFRNYVGSEISRNYCRMAAMRIKPYVEQTNLFNE